MDTKILEIRDSGTFIPVLCVDMNPCRELNDAHRAQYYYMRRAGYPCDGRPNIAIAKLSMDGEPAWNDPYGWKGRTMAVAHNFILEHWPKLKDGDVIDVEFILGERSQPKISERLEHRT